MPLSEIGNNFGSSSIFRIDRSLAQFGGLAPIMISDPLQFGWHMGRGCVVRAIDDDGRLELFKTVKGEIDVAAIFEPFAWYFREHGTNNFPDDVTFVFRNICDDRHLSHTEHDRSVQVVRLSDLKKGHLSDELIVRAIDLSPPPQPLPPWKKQPLGLSAVQPEAPPEPTGIPERVAMLQLGRFGTPEYADHLYQGPRDLEKTGRSYELIEPKLGGLIGRLCDVIVITEDDAIRTTVDGDGDSYANIRHDAHFHMSEEADGRIHFVTDPPAAETFGKEVIGVMTLDPTKADTNTQLTRESGQWRPQVKIPEEYGTPWTDPIDPPNPEPKPGELIPGGPPVGPGGGLNPPLDGDVPSTYTPYKTSMLCLGFEDQVNSVIEHESYVIPNRRINEDAVPLSFRGTFIVPIPPLDALVANNAVFKFRVKVIRDGGVAHKPTYTRHGRFDVAIPASHDPSVVAVVDLAFDGRQFEAGDMLQLVVWRDWNDAEDTAAYMVFMKGMIGLADRTVTAGHIWNNFIEDTAETTIAYPILA